MCSMECFPRNHIVNGIEACVYPEKAFMYNTLLKVLLETERSEIGQ